MLRDKFRIERAERVDLPVIAFWSRIRVLFWQAFYAAASLGLLYLAVKIAKMAWSD